MENPGQGSPGDGVAAAIAQLWEAHRGEAFERLERIEDAAAAFAAGSLGEELRGDARAAAHKLRGSAGTFGRTRASELAGEVEDLLAPDAPLGPDAVPALASLALSLRTALEADPEPLGDAAQEEPGGPTVLLVTETEELRGGLERAARARGLDLEACAPADVYERPVKERAQLLLVDLTAQLDGMSGLDLLAELAAAQPAPVVALSPSDALLERVEAARRGAHGFLQRDSEPVALVEALERYLERLHGAPATVLAVDDDGSVLAALSALLTPHGFTVETVDDPELFWERLDVGPDLAIIDLDMPQVSGLDLCRAVRTDPRWSALPLLILTAYREPEVIRQAFAAGADDYLSKPIIEEELVARVRNRLERVRAYRTEEQWPRRGATAHPRAEQVDVVMVEDDDSVAGILDLALETLGLSSRRLADGTTAAEVLAGEEPDLEARLVLLDWDLPGLDGLSVLRRLADAGVLECTRVIMLTARASEQETLNALELGASDFVSKPFSVPVLVERLRRVLER